ncbi:protease complex subunit PrcB family protein [Flavobacterium sp.]|uniref:protease complex subunit PrcB family protein n=1 Tax=Flavobacterium sp. TaxID=239 RepID=UPI002634BC97|nr:protease complex subunit PrcB family protein [Flavobacterium sp.]MDD2985082.1 protease complex subunit PrcB family protein [Flavobacterium sp.]
MKKLFLFFLSFIVISCNDDDVEPIVTPPFVPVVINPVLIAKDNQNIPIEGISMENFIINENSSWINIKNLMDAPYIAFGLGNYYTETNFTETTIDFTNYTVIAVFDQVYGNGGHSIDITNITEFENNITVTVENLQTGNTSSVVTQTYHIVKIPKATKPIVFE